MSFILVGILAQSLASPKGDPPPIMMSDIGPSPADLTDPVRTYECSVDAINGEAFTFKVKHIGQRAYRSKDDKQNIIVRAKVELLDDPDRMFADYSEWSSLGSRINAMSNSGEARFGQHVRFEFHRTDFNRDFTEPPIWAVLVQAYFGYLPLTKAVGFCQTTYSPQSPLSEKEISELEKN